MKRYPSRAGVGASSILMIVVVLTLTLFGVLAFVQARSDAALTERTALSAEAFYDADTRAQQVIALVDETLASGGSPDSIDGVTLQGDEVYAFSIGSFDGHALNVAIHVADGICQITKYRYENATEWVGGSESTLWQGD